MRLTQHLSANCTASHIIWDAHILDSETTEDLEIADNRQGKLSR